MREAERWAQAMEAKYAEAQAMAAALEAEENMP